MDERTTLKRRGILAAAGAMVAGIAMKQSSQPVGASAPVSGGNYTADGLFDVAYLTTGTFLFGVSVTGSTTGVAGTSTTGNGVAGTSTSGVGVRGTSASSYGLQGQGGLAPLRLVPAANGTGAPTTGNHGAGELYVDSAGSLFYCKSTGGVGTWVRLDAVPVSAPIFTPLPTPERFVDTRSNLGGMQGPVPANTIHAFQMTGRVGQSGNPALQIPDTATAIVGNVTVVGAAGIPLGSFLTIWPSGAQPAVSTINYGPAATAGAVANGFVVGLGSSGGHGVISVFNLSACDYIVDVTGYYASAASATAASEKK